MTFSLAIGPAHDRGLIEAQQEWSWPEFCALFAAHALSPHVGKLTRAEYLAAKNGSDEQKAAAGADKLHDWFSLATYPPGARKKNDNALTVTAFGGDLDEPRADGTRHSIVSASAALAGLNHLIATTHSHHPESPALRIVVELSRPVSPSEHPSIFRHVQNRLGGGLGSQSRNASRLWYWPSHCADTGEHVAHVAVTDAAPLDVDAVLASLPPAPPDAERAEWTTETEWKIPAGATVTERLEPYSKRHADFAAIRAGNLDEFERICTSQDRKGGNSEADFCIMQGLLIAFGGNCQAVLDHVRDPDNAVTLYGKRREEDRYLELTIRKARANLAQANSEPTICFAKPCELPAGASLVPVVTVPPPPPIVAAPVVEDWPDPVDLIEAKLDAPPFDGSEFPPEIAAFPMMFTRYTGFDSSIALNAALTVMAAAIPDYIQVCADSASSWVRSTPRSRRTRMCRS